MDFTVILPRRYSQLKNLVQTKKDNWKVHVGQASLDYASVSKADTDITIQSILQNSENTFACARISHALKVYATVTYNAEINQNQGYASWVYILSYTENDITVPVIIAQRSMDNFDATYPYTETVAFDIEISNGVTTAKLIPDETLPVNVAFDEFDATVLHKFQMDDVQSDKYVHDIPARNRKQTLENDGVLISDEDITLFNGQLKFGNGTFVTDRATRNTSITLDPCTPDTPWVAVSDVLTDADGYDFCFIVIDTTKDYQLNSQNDALTDEQNVAVLTKQRHTYVILIHNKVSPFCYEVPVSNTPNKGYQTVTLKNKIQLHPSLCNEYVTDIHALRLYGSKHYSYNKGRGLKVLMLNEVKNGVPDHFVTLWGYNPGHPLLIRTYCRMNELLEIESSFHAFVQNFSVLAVVTRNDSQLLIKESTVGMDTDSPVNGEFICVSHGRVYKSTCTYNRTTQLWTDRNGTEEVQNFVDVGFENTLWYLSDKLVWKADCITFNPLTPTTKSGNKLQDPPEIYIPTIEGEEIRRNNVVGYSVKSSDSMLSCYAMTLQDNSIAYHELVRFGADPLCGTARIFVMYQYDSNGLSPEPVTITNGFSVLQTMNEIEDEQTGTIEEEVSLLFTCQLDITDRNFFPLYRYAIINTYLYPDNSEGACVEMSHKSFCGRIVEDVNDHTSFSMDISAVVSYMNIIAEQYFNNNAVEMNGFVMIEIL